MSSILVITTSLRTKSNSDKLAQRMIAGAEQNAVILPRVHIGDSKCV